MKKGFTLIELLVVISIIALLSSIVLASINSARDKARISETIQNLRAIETAFSLYLTDKQLARVPSESALGAGANPTIQTLANNSNILKPFLPNVPTASVGNGLFRYDNDGGGSFRCGTDAVNAGTSIFVSGVSISDANKINAVIDGDGTLSCGKIRINGSDLLWAIDDAR